MTDRERSKVIAIDPGATCGVSIGVGSDIIGAYHLQADEFLQELWDALWTRDYQAYDRVVVERFVPRRIDNDAQRTIEVIGAIKFICNGSASGFAMVNAADKKKTMPLVPGWINNAHERDAEAIRLWDLRYGTWI